jgi:FkbM family methyltransferase
LPDVRRRVFWALAAILAAAWRAVPVRGVGRILELLVVRPARHFGDGVIKVAGSTTLIHFDNPPEAELFIWRSYERDVAAAIRAGLEPGMTAIDVGANCGVNTLAMRRAVAAGGRVISIDPSPAACKRVQEQVGANGFTNVDVVQRALGETPRSSEVYYTAAVGIGALPPVDRDHVRPDSLTVSSGTVDDLVEELGLESVDLIKIDTDGGEVQILRGAHKTLSRFHPILVLEVNGPGLARRGNTADELLAFLTAMGYRLLSPRFAPRPVWQSGPACLTGFTDELASARWEVGDENLVAVQVGEERHEAVERALTGRSG